MLRVPEMTLRAARRLITTPKPRSAGTQGPRQAATKAAKPAPALNSLAWSGASLEERRRFLDAVGAASLLAALSDSMRQEINVGWWPRRQGVRSLLINRLVMTSIFRRSVSAPDRHLTSN